MGTLEFEIPSDVNSIASTLLCYYLFFDEITPNFAFKISHVAFFFFEYRKLLSELPLYRRRHHSVRQSFTASCIISSSRARSLGYRHFAKLRKKRLSFNAFSFA